MNRLHLLLAHDFSDALILVIVYDLDIKRIAAAPVEADSPLLIDPDAVLSVALAVKFFEPIAWTRQVAQFLGSAKDPQLTQRHALNVMR
jgi:hypothetical protein